MEIKALLIENTQISKLDYLFLYRKILNVLLHKNIPLGLHTSLFII